MKTNTRKLMTKRSRHFHTTLSFCQHLQRIVDKTEREEKWDMVRGDVEF